MTPEDICKEAASILVGARLDSHGECSIMCSKIAEYWSVYLGEPISQLDVANMMELLKVARSVIKPNHLDNYVDRCGYAAIAGALSKAR